MTAKFSKLAADEFNMRRALALARRGSGGVSPNPLVGAVVVKDGQIVGSGWHQQAGAAHAEIEALREAGDGALGAEMYVNLEPCNHYGRTPPCTDAIISAGIKRVVVPMHDPNPKVKGGGLEKLRKAGIEVTLGVLENEAVELNIAWFYWQKTGRPFIALKLASSLDGKIATKSGDSQWISGPNARMHVQRLRRHVDAVMVGSGTVMADNPKLTNRTGVGSQPLRVIIDSELRVPATANVYRPLGLNEQGPMPISLVFTTSKAPFARRKELELSGVEVVVADGEDGHVDLDEALTVLGERSVQSVLCEGGAALATLLLERKLCQRLLLYQAPMLIGSEGQSFFNMQQCETIASAVVLELMWARRIAADVVSVFKVRES